MSLSLPLFSSTCIDWGLSLEVARKRWLTKRHGDVSGTSCSYLHFLEERVQKVHGVLSACVSPQYLSHAELAAWWNSNRFRVLIFGEYEQNLSLRMLIFAVEDPVKHPPSSVLLSFQKVFESWDQNEPSLVCRIIALVDMMSCDILLEYSACKELLDVAWTQLWTDSENPSQRRLLDAMSSLLPAQLVERLPARLIPLHEMRQRRYARYRDVLKMDVMQIVAQICEDPEAYGMSFISKLCSWPWGPCFANNAMLVSALISVFSQTLVVLDHIRGSSLSASLACLWVISVTQVLPRPCEPENHAMWIRRSILQAIADSMNTTSVNQLLKECFGMMRVSRPIEMIDMMLDLLVILKGNLGLEQFHKHLELFLVFLAQTNLADCPELLWRPMLGFIQSSLYDQTCRNFRICKACFEWMILLMMQNAVGRVHEIGSTDSDSSNRMDQNFALAKWTFGFINDWIRFEFQHLESPALENNRIPTTLMNAVMVVALKLESMNKKDHDQVGSHASTMDKNGANYVDMALISNMLLVARNGSTSMAYFQDTIQTLADHFPSCTNAKRFAAILTSMDRDKCNNSEMSNFASQVPDFEHRAKQALNSSQFFPMHDELLCIVSDESRPSPEPSAQARRSHQLASMLVSSSDMDLVRNAEILAAARDHLQIMNHESDLGRLFEQSDIAFHADFISACMTVALRSNRFRNGLVATFHSVTYSMLELVAKLLSAANPLPTELLHTILSYSDVLHNYSKTISTNHGELRQVMDTVIGALQTHSE